MNRPFSFILLASLLSLANAQQSNLYFQQTGGDKISLYGNKFNQDDMYGFGIESSTLYFKTNSMYRWYVKDNADFGVSDVLQLWDSNLKLLLR